MKKCVLCKINLELVNFSKDGSRSDGLDSTCKKCKKAQREIRNEKDVFIPLNKTCSECKQLLGSDFFDKKPDGLHSQCKNCKKEKRLKIKQENKEKILPDNYNKICTNCNILKQKNDFYTQIYSTDGIGTKCIDCDKIRHDMWRKKNPKKVAEYRTRTYFKNYKNNREFNTQVKISGNIRNRVRQAIKSQKSAKFKNTFELIDCSPEYMVKWLEYQFNENMSWNNYGSYWQIDHVIPCDFFKLNEREEQLNCFNWRNCRPCESRKNQSKNNKIQPLQIFLQEIKVHYYERHIQIAGKP